MELGKTAYVILGMLRMGKRTGYEIKSLVDVSTRFFWAASYGQIYPELKRLEQAGLVRGEADPQGGRQRRAYELTPAGEETLHDWLTSGGGLHSELRHEGVLRFFFAGRLAPLEQVELVRTIRAEHERVRDELVAIRPMAEQKRVELDDPFPLMTLEWGITYHDHMVAWCETTEHTLAEQATEKLGA